MAILLPHLPGIRSAEPELMDFGNVLQGPQGGAAQRLNRIGDRFAISVELPPALSATHGRIYVARLLKARREGALYPFPQPGLEIGAPGLPVVDGNDQAGSVLKVRGATPH
ncbi:hypothetical protein PYV61_26350, partial [Roseisolibacter sp. H3M3-2]